MSNKKPIEQMPPLLVWGSLGSLATAFGLTIAAIFVDKPLTSIFILLALALFVAFFVLAYKLGKAIEEYEKGELTAAKAVHPAGAKPSSTYSVLNPPEEDNLTSRYLENSFWNKISKDRGTILRRWVLTEGRWVEIDLTTGAKIPMGGTMQGPEAETPEKTDVSG